MVILIARSSAAESKGELKKEETSTTAQSRESQAASQAILEAHIKRLTVEIEQLKQENENLRQKLDQTQRELENIRMENLSLQEKVVMVQRWQKATFIVTSKRAAVGIQPIDQGQFRVVTTAEYPHTDYVLHIARRLNIPRVFQADKIAMALSEEVGQQIVPEQLAYELRKFWKPHNFVRPGPGEDATFVTFKDLETDRQRVGFLLNVSEREVTFQPVAASIETVQRSRIESGTALKGNADRILADPGADFLDVCILRLAQHLSFDEAAPGWLTLAVDINVDDLEEEIARSRVGGVSDTKVFDSNSLAGLAPYIGDTRTEPGRILRRYATYLQDEVGSRLSRLGIPVVEREELNQIIAERDLADTRSFEPRDYAGLVSASHVVMIDVDRPRNGGDFRLSVRLVTADTGNKIFEDNGDIGRKRASIPGAGTHFWCL
ncbi:MAG: hypothetical protein H6822_18460 [Planctomycetaceae bacterium]|nr:hypothetical protein [Planctomycetales bacterium]MCB9924170.1 hypothetical protein [Planctomycetaceae bacterium]